MVKDQENFGMGSSTQGDEVIIDLQHFPQVTSWDCGLACLLMVLNDETRSKFVKNKYKICREEGFGVTIWTIDLAYLLKRFNVEHTYFTTTLGVDPGYKKQKFYTNNFHECQARVENRFREAAQKGIDVQQKLVTLDEIINHLASRRPAIVLVNANLLLCERCAYPFPLLYYFTSRLPFQGHYVVLVGFQPLQERIFYRNPGRQDEICSVSYSRFEKARLCYGTDADIIFIN